MRHLRRPRSFLAGAGLLIAGVAGACAPAAHAARPHTQPFAVRGPSAGTRAGDAELRDLLVRINRHRRAIGLGALAWDGRLARVAQAHSEDMAHRAFFDHVNPDGRGPFDRMDRAGIAFRAAAENLAAGQQTGRETFDGWMRSPGHRENLEGRLYTRIGLGLCQGRWTCVLARPAPGGGRTQRT